MTLGPCYTPEELDAWLNDASPPLIHRKGAAGNGASADNPFEAFAKTLGSDSAPIDVEARLAAMQYNGPGDSGIHLTQLQCSASLLRQGMPIEDVVARILEATRRAAGAEGERWNWQGEASTIRDMCLTGAQKYQKAQEAPPGEEAPKPKLLFIDMARWDFEPTPEQDWAVDNRIPRRECVLLSGEGAAGKSTIKLHLCAAHSLRREWLGVVPEQGPSIFIDAEDDEKVLHRRLKAIAAHYGVGITEMIRAGLHLVSWRGSDATLATVARNGKIEPTPLYKQLLEAAGDIKPIMIGIAAAANVFAGNENDRSQVQQFVGLLTRVAMIANGTVSLISHPSLTGISSESGLSGSTQWHNAVRARGFLRGVKPEAGEPLDTDLRELVWRKNNYGPVTDSIVLRWSNGLFLPVPGAIADQAAKEAIAQDMFLALLKRFREQNRYVSEKPSANYAPALFAREEDARRAGLTKNSLTRAMRLLFQRGTIWNEPCGRPARPSYRIAPRNGA